MLYDKNIHHRRSIRLKGYDYSRSGLYYITICTNKKAYLFGVIKDEKMFLNPAGEMIGKIYLDIEKRYCDVFCEDYIIMPNHAHFIINKKDNDIELSTIIGEFKSLTTNKYIQGIKEQNWKPFEEHLW